MNRQKAMEHLIGALVESGADFSATGGILTVGGTTFTCREDYIVVSIMEQATNFFQYATLSYICSQGDSVSIADSHAGVFGTYKVK